VFECGVCVFFWFSVTREQSFWIDPHHHQTSFFGPSALYCDTFPEVRGEGHHLMTTISCSSHAVLAWVWKINCAF
jgi:hypothetical protein